MKYLNMISLLWLIIAAMACNKKATVVVSGDTLPHQPVPLELVDKNGKSLITSINDKVSITYTSVSGATDTLPKVLIEKLQVSLTDTTASKNYNGFWINDHAGMADAELAGGVYAPIKNNSNTFNIALNGKSMGSIYLDYNAHLHAYPAALTLNNIPAVADNNAGFVQVWVFATGN